MQFLRITLSLEESTSLDGLSNELLEVSRCFIDGLSRELLVVSKCLNDGLNDDVEREVNELTVLVRDEDP